jgi:hypothetical protein
MDELLSVSVDDCCDTVSMRLRAMTRIEELTEFGFEDSLIHVPKKVHPHR